MQKTENVFHNRNFRLVFLGALVSELGALLYSFAVSFYILQISGNNAFLQGLYLALCSVAMLLFTPVGGVLGDRFSKAKIMYVCDFCKGGTIILATVLMLFFPESDAHIVNSCFQGQPVFSRCVRTADQHFGDTGSNKGSADNEEEHMEW